MIIFFIPDFLTENLKVNKNWRKRSLILQYKITYFTNRNFLTMKIICSQNTAKKRSQFTNFPVNMFLFGVRKNNIIPQFPDFQKLLSWRIFKENVYIFLYISLRKFLFQRRSKILSGGIGSGGKYFLRRLAVWALQNVLRFFI